MKRIYLAGGMSGIPHFNFPTFHKASAHLRSLGYEVFSPAEADIARHGGIDISKGNKTGCVKEAEANYGFSLRSALAEDTAFICNSATTIALLPGWENSRGANAEWSLAKALGLEIIYLSPEDFDDPH
jgi:hypothetical protein